MLRSAGLQDINEAGSTACREMKATPIASGGRKKMTALPLQSCFTQAVPNRVSVSCSKNVFMLCEVQVSSGTSLKISRLQRGRAHILHIFKD